MIPARVRDCCCALLLLMSVAATATAGPSPLEEFEVLQPRPYGYRIGDKIEQTVTFSLRGAYALKTESLPAAGRASAWLALAPPLVEQRWGGRVTDYKVRFVYQVVNIDPAVPDIAVPSQFLQYSNGSETLQVLVPPTRVRVSMLGGHEPGELQPARQPRTLALPNDQLLLACALLACGLGGLALIRWGLPSTRRKPFARAFAALRRQRGEDWNEAACRRALLTVHQAFNQTAERTVFAQTLDEFFAQNPRYAGLRDRITAFYMRSREYFFAPGPGSGTVAYSYADIEEFVRACCDVERGLA